MTLDEALSEWSQEGFHLQNFFAEYGQTETDLYEGDPAKAVARVGAFWPDLKRHIRKH